MEGSVYLKARQEWDERYADLVLGKRNWQITAAGMMAITLVLAFGMVWVSARSKFVPYVVEVDKLGYAIGAPSALTESTSRISTDRMVRYELAAFIRNAREVITDPAAEHQLIGQVYSRARGPAYKFLENYYHENDLEHDPFKVAQSIRRVAPKITFGENEEPRANYLVAVAGRPSSLKHAPAAAHIPNPAPVATSSAAAPIMGTPAPANAPQAPGESDAEVGIAAGATAQFSVRPSFGTVWLTAPGWPAPAGGFNVVLYCPGAIPVMQYLPASLVVPCPTTFPPASATVT